MDTTERSYVFVVTYGRSGSTLINGVLNSIPGFLIRGENGDALRKLHRFHRTMARNADKYDGRWADDPTSPWFGIPDFPRERSIELCRQLVVETVLRPEPDTRVTGFKEIRWAGADLDAYVEWLRLLFPQAKFLVNTRQTSDVVKSGMWARNNEQVDTIDAADRQLLALAESLGDAAFHVHYDDYTADPSVLEGMFHWLGEPWDEASVRATLGTKHSH